MAQAWERLPLKQSKNALEKVNREIQLVARVGDEEEDPFMKLDSKESDVGDLENLILQV